MSDAEDLDQQDLDAVENDPEEQELIDSLAEVGDDKRQPELMDGVKQDADDDDERDPLLDMYPSMEQGPGGMLTHRGLSRAASEGLTRDTIQQLGWQSIEAQVEELSPALRARLRERWVSMIQQHPSETDLRQTYGGLVERFVRLHLPGLRKDAEREDFLRSVYPNSNL